MISGPPNHSDQLAEFHTCSSQKAVFLTREAALEDRRRIRASFERKRLFVYQCDRCGFFHLSSDKRQASLRRARHLSDRLQREREAALEAERAALAAEVEERRRRNRPPSYPPDFG